MGTLEKVRFVPGQKESTASDGRVAKEPLHRKLESDKLRKKHRISTFPKIAFDLLTVDAAAGTLRAQA